MKCTVVSILQERNHFNNNSGCFVFPLYKNKRRLRQYNIRLNFFNSISKKLFDCDVLIISSRFAKEKQWWHEKNRSDLFKFLSDSKKKVDKIIWADLLDATATSHFEVLPYVDRYIKSYILSDKMLYQSFFYGSRYHTDYYHKKYNIQDDDPGEPHLNFKPAKEDIEKLHVSWNQAFYNHNYFGYNYMRVKRYLNFLPNLYFIRFTSPGNERKILLSSRFSTNYRRNTVSFQRKKIVEMLDSKFPSTKISRKQYFNELRNSHVVISPFGWGETSYRDYDIMISGATLMKPDCDHMETWPDLYQKDKTYLSFSWDFSDINEIIMSLPDRLEQLSEIAEAAQNRYRYYLSAEGGRMEFCTRFRSLIDFN